MFMDIALSFPTVIFSVFFAVSTALWLVSIIGLLDIEANSVDMEMGDVSATGQMMGVLSRLGLSGVPITIVLSLLSMIGWTVSFTLQYFAMGLVGSGVLMYVLGAVIFVVTFWLSIKLTALFCKPLRVSLASHSAINKAQLIGQMVVVRSMSVTATFGEAVFSADGVTMNLRIRDSEQKGFTAGDQVVLLKYDSTADAFAVISTEEFNGF